MKTEPEVLGAAQAAEPQGPPAEAEARRHFSLAQASHAAGRPREALAGYLRAAEILPGAAPIHYNAGIVLLEMGREIEAADAFERALAIDPDQPAGWNNLGIARLALDRGAEALACFERAVRIDPGYAQAHANAGRVHFEAQRWEDARRCLERALVLRPAEAEAWHHLGLCFHKMRDFDQAQTCYAQALCLNPQHHAAHVDSGNVCLDRGDLNAMADWYRKALTLAAPDPRAAANVGRMLQNLGRLEEALACHDTALAHDPGNAEVHFDRAAILLALGRWEEGWPEYEWRLRRRDWRSGYPHRLAAPRWTGPTFVGKTLLVHCEQGLGDALQFVRYLPLVKARGGTVLLEAPQALLGLFASLRGVDRLLAFSPSRPPAEGFDLQVPLLSLPGLFGTSPKSLPDATPYLAADPLKARRWAARLSGDGLRVGVVWAASGWNETLALKNLRLADLAEQLRRTGHRFYGLQKGAAGREAAEIEGGTWIANLGEELTDFSDTAAAVANLGLVLSVDTAVAHLAGAMGKPVWVLLPFRADWRWMVKRADSPWYPTMRLFRQERPGDWQGVFRQVAQALEELRP